MNIVDKIIDLANDGFEDLHVPVGSIEKLIELTGAHFPLLVNGHKVWIHLEGLPWDSISMERDISDGSMVELDFSKEDEDAYQRAIKIHLDHFEFTERLRC